MFREDGGGVPTARPDGSMLGGNGSGAPRVLPVTTAVTPAQGERDMTESALPDAGIVARGVRRTFGDVVAVDAMDLDAPPGQVTALVGPNGAGKTTLLLVLATLLVPDSGSLTVAGFDPVVQPREVRRRTGWMPDAFGTWESLTCREVLRTVADAYRIDSVHAFNRTNDLLELVHLGDLADRPTQVLSRGQKQRLGLARALVHSPSVLLLDEPASGLDPRSRVELRTIVRDLADAGAAVLVSSHVLAELDELADRAVIVSDGRTVAVETLAAPSTTARPWSVRARDVSTLVGALDSLGRPHGAPDDAGAVELEISSDDDAADLLAALVRDGVRVVALQPSGGVLEQAYLALTSQDRT
jgi:ABC-2 type transport system ATP-binding protein